MRLQTRFLLNQGILAILVLGVFAFFIQQGIDSFNQDEIDNRLSTHLTLTNEFMNGVLDNVSSDLDLISNNSLTRRYFSAGQVVRYQLFHSELTRTLNRYLKHSNYYTEIAIVLPDAFKDIYVSNRTMTDEDEDPTLLMLGQKTLARENGITFAIEEKGTGTFMLVAYSPIHQISDLLEANINPVFGYIKISIDLKQLALNSTTQHVITSFVYNDAIIFNDASALQVNIDLTQPYADYTTSNSTEIFNNLYLQSTLRNDIILDTSKKLFRQSLVILLFAILSLLAMTFILLKNIILKPLKRFSDLVEHSQTNQYEVHSHKHYKNSEFGKLKHRFDNLMIRLSESSADLERQAFTDTLTKLPNRAALYRLLEHHVKNHRLKPISILFLDLDGFKQVNDIYGHELGDQLLVEVANRLTNIVRGDFEKEFDGLDTRRDAVIRLGGDEFTIVLSENSNAEVVANRIIHTFQAGINVDGKVLYTGASIGISKYPSHASTPSLLIQYADLAMYQAKNQGKMRFCTFSSNLAHEQRKRLTIEKTVREGIEFNRFEAHFQAKTNATTGKIEGLEALARLKDSEGQIVSPDQFIPIAQENGVLEYITYVVTEQVCKLLQKLDAPSLVASINITPSQLNDMRLIADIRTIMWRYQIKPNQIEFEVTEEELITNADVAKRNLDLLRRFGFRTALDDFGAGYSSLGQLKKFSFDTLKLDRIFVSTDDYDSDAAVGVITSIKSLADTLDMTIVAEGIETAEQIEFIQSFGIELIQGFYCSRPLPMDSFVDFYHKIQNTRPCRVSSTLLKDENH